jgi:glycosyltransferase involved in cell wall biosynthesis
MKKRIAFISEHASPLALLGGVDSGGQNVYVSQVACHLSKLGYEVDVFTRWDNTNYKRIEQLQPGVRVIHVEAGPKEFIVKEKLFQYMDEFASDMIHWIQKNKPDYKLIHAHFWMSGYVAAIVKNILNIPYVITFHALGKIRRIHQGTADGFPDTRFKIEEEVAKEADMVFAECPQDKEDLMIHYLVNEDKIKIVPCGFDKQEFFPINKRTARLKLGLNPAEPIILQLGRMVKRKGVDNVINAMSLLSKNYKVKSRLLIVGGESDLPDPIQTPEIGRLLDLASKEKILDRITFIGRRSREHLKYFYNAADLFITTPWYEPFGITPLEAMACGVPVIGSNVGGIKYSIDHCKTGFLVPPNEPEILYQRITEILDDPLLIRKFSINALNRVNTLFTWEIVSKTIAKLYSEISTIENPVSEKIQNSLFERIGFKRREKISIE